jgi:hypothetical protein
VTSWWGRVGPVKRVVTVVVGLVVGLNVVLAALDSVIGSDPGGPTGSSFATGDDGVAAWSDLLRVRAADVEALREPLADADLPGGGTVVLVEPEDGPTPDGLSALAAHLGAGGRVVTIGATGATWAGALVGSDLGWQPDGTTRPAPAGTLLAGLDDLRGAGAGSFAPPGPGVTVEAGPADAPVVVSAGGLVAVADPTLLQNAHLADGDNAALAVVLTTAPAASGPPAAGGPPARVAFAEAEHGYGAARGLDAVPGRWRATAVGLVLATLLGFWSVGQRLGPAEATDRLLPPPRRAYVDALAAALARTPAPAPEPATASPEDPGPVSQERRAPTAAAPRTAPRTAHRTEPPPPGGSP